MQKSNAKGLRPVCNSFFKCYLWCVIRFFSLSLLLHALVFGFLRVKKSVIIENPIWSVELQPTPEPQPAATSAKPVVKKTQPLAPTKNENVSPHSPTEVPIESQLITVKPRVLHQEKVEYPLEAEKSRVEGAVKLSVTIDTKGEVSEVQVLEGPGFGLNEAAESALRKFKFTPAEKDGEKVSVRITYVYRFRLDSR